MLKQNGLLNSQTLYAKWVTTAEISKPLPHSMLSLNDRHQVHLDFVTSVDFLGTIYRAYEDLITADPANWLGHMTNCDIILGKVRKGFKRLETFVISDNYFRSILGLPPALYPENQPSQSALEQNSSEYLTSLAHLK